MEHAPNRIHLVLASSESTGDVLCVRAFKQSARAQEFTQQVGSRRDPGSREPLGLRLRVVPITLE
jgi:hypothetical protein